MSFAVRVKTRLLQLVQQLGDAPSRFVRDPKRDFTRQRKLPLTTIVHIILTTEASSLKKELLKAFLQMLHRGPFSKKTIFVMDRGYESYDVLGSIYQMGMSFVLRAKDGSTGGS